MEKETIWEYNGQQYELDLQDVDTIERYENAFNKMAEKEKALQKRVKKSEEMRDICTLLYGVFDEIFGDGTSTKMFGDRLNSGKAADAYISFLAFARAQMDFADEQRQTITARYSGDRAKRA